VTAAEVIRAARVELAKRERAKGPIQRVAERAANLKALNEAIERWQGLPRVDVLGPPWQYYGVRRWEP
jgi:hypothetical protein